MPLDISPELGNQHKEKCRRRIELVSIKYVLNLWVSDDSWCMCTQCVFCFLFLVFQIRFRPQAPNKLNTERTYARIREKQEYNRYQLYYIKNLSNHRLLLTSLTIPSMTWYRMHWKRYKIKELTKNRIKECISYLQFMICIFLKNKSSFHKCINNDI